MPGMLAPLAVGAAALAVRSAMRRRAAPSISVSSAGAYRLTERQKRWLELRAKAIAVELKGDVPGDTCRWVMYEQNLGIVARVTAIAFAGDPRTSPAKWRAAQDYVQAWFSRLCH